MQKLYNKLEHLENLIIAMNQNGMNRIKLPIPERYGGGYATGDSLESAVNNLIKRIETYKIDQSPLFSDYYEEWIDLKKSMFTKMWRRINATIDLKGATSHSFRASYASMVTAHCNADPKTLQRLLRHKTPDLAMRVYAKANENKIRTTENAYDAYISKLVGTPSNDISAQNQ